MLSVVWRPCLLLIHVCRGDCGTQGESAQWKIPRDAIACPTVSITNIWGGGVYKSDQYLACHNICLYSIQLHGSPVRVENNENDFCDALVLHIICKYGRKRRESTPAGRVPRSDCRVGHGSILLPPAQKSRYQYCKMHCTTSWTQWKRPDCCFYQHCARQQSGTVRPTGIPLALITFAPSGLQEGRLEFHLLKQTAKCTTQLAGHSGNVLTVCFYQHCARQQSGTVMPTGIPLALITFAPSGLQGRLEFHLLKQTCSYYLVLLHNFSLRKESHNQGLHIVSHNQGHRKVRWNNHRSSVAVQREPSTNVAAVAHTIPSDYIIM